ncbi:MAG: secretin and TonB N-terminal domain-containing protein [Holophagales bacterium]|nr:secretin and TonB N-terminal domain-containing protein [Holophagales bacterium]
MKNVARSGLLATFLVAAAPPGFAGSEAPCGSLDTLRARLAGAKTAGERSTVANAFASCAAREGTPLVFPAAGPGRVRCLFAFRSGAARVFLAGDQNGWYPSSQPLEKLPGSDLHLLELEIPDGARLDYKFVVEGTEWTLDPWNPRTMPGGFGPNSELRTPGYVPPPDVDPNPGAPKGRYEELAIESRAMGGPRRAIVWVPPAPAAGTEPFPVLYLLDGLDYREFARVHTVAANLVAARKLPPILLVLVPPVDRNVEYERSEAFERFLVTELVPAVESRWKVRTDPAGRGVMGVSLGAFAALSAAARHPGVFGRCGAQSTGNAVEANFDALLADLARLPASSVRFHLDVGTFESNLHGADLLSASRRLRSVLARRQELQYREVPEGHSWGSWRARLAEAWTFFWGEAPAQGRDTRGEPHALAAPPGGASRFTGNPVSLDVKDADLAELVRSLTAGRGLSVVAPPGLSGTVTATLRDVPWDQALELALAGNGWGYVREGTVIRIVRRSDPGR